MSASSAKALIAVHANTPGTTSHLVDAATAVPQFASARIEYGPRKTLCGEGVSSDWVIDLRLGRDVDCGECMRLAAEG